MRRLLNLRKHIEEISFIRYTISIHAQTSTNVNQRNTIWRSASNRISMKRRIVKVINEVPP